MSGRFGKAASQHLMAPSDRLGSVVPEWLAVTNLQGYRLSDLRHSQS
jgi:hypothetical protein